MSNKYVMQQDTVISTTTGHTIRFKKGQATIVPDAAVTAVMARGAVPAEEKVATEAASTTVVKK